MNPPVVAGMFEDFARIMERWVERVMAALTDTDADLAWSRHLEVYQRLRVLASDPLTVADLRAVIQEQVVFTLNRICYLLDAGEWVDDERLFPVDENHEDLIIGLHDEFLWYLTDTGRDW